MKQLHGKSLLDDAALNKSTAFTRDERKRYDQLLRDHDAEVDYQHADEHTLTVLESWQDMAALNAHLQTAHMQAYQAEVENDVVGVKIRILAAA